MYLLFYTLHSCLLHIGSMERRKWQRKKTLCLAAPADSLEHRRWLQLYGMMGCPAQELWEADTSCRGGLCIQGQWCHEHTALHLRGGRTVVPTTHGGSLLSSISSWLLSGDQRLAGSGSAGKETKRWNWKLTCHLNFHCWTLANGSLIWDKNKKTPQNSNANFESSSSPEKVERKKRDWVDHRE